MMNSKKTWKKGNRHIKAVLFDFDGTLTAPGALDFSVIKKTVGCPADEPVLEFIDTIQDDSQRQKALDTLEQFEMAGAQNSVPNPYAEEIIEFIKKKNLAMGIISRNGIVSIKKAFEQFNRTSLKDFHLVISRDDPVKPKPSSEGIFFAAKRLNVTPEEILVVGDYIFDIQAGNRAGSITVLLKDPDRETPFTADSDYTISSLSELKHILMLGLPLSPGKLPSDFLAAYLEGIEFNDPSLLIPPGIGEDTAAVDVEKEDVLILKSDPITFVTQNLGYYSVLINANDIATSGATPRWFLSTLLFPPGILLSRVLEVMNDLMETCQQLGITLVGGHTEITDSVTRPIVSGMLAGTVKKSSLMDKKKIRPGDRILLTKKVAVEGTAIIAGEFGETLKKLGMKDQEIQASMDFLSSISVLKEAEIAGNHEGVTAMHDVTEGGLSTALYELSKAGDHRIHVRMDDIPYYAETEKVCQLLDIHPLGLIGSGSLLISCRKKTYQALIKKIKDAGIHVTCIGEVGKQGVGIKATLNGCKTSWPEFEVDEITRLF
ncbi:MAG: HAD-IA family hydrolase [Desulfobacterales bacterium]|nr:HAD-IA family hydrolase [Desulfobacterales bacterium]